MSSEGLFHSITWPRCHSKLLHVVGPLAAKLLSL